MTTLLSDHDCEGQARRILYRMRRLGYTETHAIEINYFVDVGISSDSSDEEVWMFCQRNQYFLLTGNRTRKAGNEALHSVLDRLADEKSLPVITIGNLNRLMKDSLYCEACVESIVRIVLDIEFNRGIPRLYVP